ncbi:DUF1827 family protein [uncultured Enterococcus sp.]|uniref:DUF1827 family protein n=1 Tax=uncultured Enterococcus sp. TaxID=167972 RepID=UPI002AA713C9|nr:DUF1827 family protein [uncultured Enterococcus sp.]
MKLVETPLHSNLDLGTLYPNVTGYLSSKKPIKYYKLYSLDRTQVIYADVFDKINIVLVNSRKKISKQEIDYVIKRLLDTTREHVDIHLDMKAIMEKKGFTPSKPVKDLILIQMEAEE